jgi:uncharacterized protein YecT (DUF1311 family)
MMRITLIIGLFLAASLQNSPAEEPNCDSASTQLELNACAQQRLDAADKKLNEVYQAVLRKEANDKTFIKKLRESQRAWIAYRDAELEATFACEEENPRICWGSMLPMCQAAYQAALTRQRTERLKKYLEQGRPADDCH